MTIPRGVKTRVVLPRTKAAETGDRLLEAGLRVLLEQGMSTPLAVRISDVVATQHQTTGAAYKIWPNQLAYQRDLATYVIDRFPTPPATLGDHDTWHTAIVQLADRYLALLSDDANFTHRLHLSAVAYHDATLREELKGYHDRAQTNVVALLSALLDEFGLQVAEPYTLDDLATAVTATIEGSALRRHLDPTRIDRCLTFHTEQGTSKAWTLVAFTLDALTTAFTTPTP